MACDLSAAISAAYLLTQHRSVTGATLFLRSVGLTCVTVVEKRRKKRIKKTSHKNDANERVERKRSNAGKCSAQRILKGT